MKYILKLKIIGDYFITTERGWVYLSDVNRQLLDDGYPLIGNTTKPSQALEFDTLRDARKMANLLLTRKNKAYIRPIKETQIVPIPE